MLQTVYGTIKRERPQAIRSVNKMYTTAKEKYMIEFIKGGHEFSDETIKHAFGHCYDFQDLDDGKYVYTSGLIEYPRKHFQCQSLHHLNQGLICNNGVIYYPADMLSNPCGEWRPDESKRKPKIQKMYTMIREKLPDHWYRNELHKCILKPFVHMIETRAPLSEDIKRHVLNECDVEHHSLGGYNNCLLLRQNRMFDTECFRFHDGMLEFVQNLEFRDHTGIISIPVPQLKFRNQQTPQQVTVENIRPWSPLVCVNKIYDRIIQRDLTCPESANKILLTWQENCLKDLRRVGADIPNEVISRVLDGCHTFGHQLTEQYTCCRGYILHRDIYFHHDVRECLSNHTINQDKECYEGRIYHRCPEIPKGYYGQDRRFVLSGAMVPSFALGVGEAIDLNDKAKVVNPAPPPRDHLDPNADDVQHNIAADRQNVDAIDERAEVVAEEPYLDEDDFDI